MNYEYDVALSFAGEDRKFVEDCAEILRALNINVFYDNYEIEIIGNKVSFKCEEENFYDEYPLGFIMELYRQDLIEKAFALPVIVPN